jgi:hypothetical protein
MYGQELPPFAYHQWLPQPITVFGLVTFHPFYHLLGGWPHNGGVPATLGLTNDPHPHVPLAPYLSHPALPHLATQRETKKGAAKRRGRKKRGRKRRRGPDLWEGEVNGEGEREGEDKNEDVNDTGGGGGDAPFVEIFPSSNRCGKHVKRKNRLCCAVRGGFYRAPIERLL